MKADGEWDFKSPKTYNNQMGHYKTQVEYSFIRKHLNNVSNILDLGGGSGRFAIPLREKGYDITLIDLREKSIELSKKRGIEKAYCMDLKHFEGSNFDLVLAIELFLSVSPVEVIKVAYKSLRANGCLITVGTNKRSWRYKLHKMHRGISTNYGELSVKEYVELFSGNGFDIVEIEGFNWMPFGVISNNILVPLFSKLESILSLNKWLSQSPYLLFACRKISSKNE